VIPQDGIFHDTSTTEIFHSIVPDQNSGFDTSEGNGNSGEPGDVASGDCVIS